MIVLYKLYIKAVLVFKVIKENIFGCFLNNVLKLIVKNFLLIYRMGNVKINWIIVKVVVCVIGFKKVGNGKFIICFIVI